MSNYRSVEFTPDVLNNDYYTDTWYFELWEETPDRWDRTFMRVPEFTVKHSADNRTPSPGGGRP